MFKTLHPYRSALMWLINFGVRDVIPFMLVRQADICPLDCEGIHVLTKIPTSLNLARVLINVGNLAVIIVSQF